MRFKIIPLIVIISLIVTCKKKKDDTVPKNEVYINNMAYNPATITVSAGTTIKWTNKESSLHTVTSDSASFSSGDMPKDKEFSFTFSTKGTFSYHCFYHLGMKGTVIVN